MAIKSTYSIILVSSLLLSPVYANAFQKIIPSSQNVAQQSYGQQVGEKGLNGLTNVGTAWLEIPKNVIKTSQETNILYGIIGGLGKGVFNTLGRFSSGVFDLVSAPFPTDPIVNPIRPWEKFGTKTTYGTQFHHEEPTNQMPTR